MSIVRSRTAHAVVDRPRGRTMGWWALWITLTALSTGIAGICAAALYLHSGQPAWPPAPIERPVGWYALLMVVLTSAGAFVTHRAKTRLRAGDLRGATGSLLLAGALSTGVLLVAGLDLANAGFRWDEHAYASVYWVNTVLAAVFVGVGVLMQAAVTVQRLIGVLDEERMLELELTSDYLWWTIPAVVALLAAAHLLPDPTGGAVAVSQVVVR